MLHSWQQHQHHRHRHRDQHQRLNYRCSAWRFTVEKFDATFKNASLKCCKALRLVMCPQSLQIPKTSTRSVLSICISTSICICSSISICICVCICFDCCSLCLGKQARLKTHQQFIKTHQYSSKCLSLRTSTSTLTLTPTPTSSLSPSPNTKPEMKCLRLI